jgi:hypothetical protein
MRSSDSLASVIYKCGSPVAVRGARIGLALLPGAAVGCRGTLEADPPPIYNAPRERATSSSSSSSFLAEMRVDEMRPGRPRDLSPARLSRTTRTRRARESRRGREGAEQLPSAPPAPSGRGLAPRHGEELVDAVGLGEERTAVEAGRVRQMHYNKGARDDSRDSGLEREVDFGRHLETARIYMVASRADARAASPCPSLPLPRSRARPPPSTLASSRRAAPNGTWSVRPPPHLEVDPGPRAAT